MRSGGAARAYHACSSPLEGNERPPCTNNSVSAQYGDLCAQIHGVVRTDARSLNAIIPQADRFLLQQRRCGTPTSSVERAARDAETTQWEDRRGASRFVIRPDRKYLRLFADACRPHEQPRTLAASLPLHVLLPSFLVAANHLSDLAPQSWILLCNPYQADSAAMGQLNGTCGLHIYPLNAHAVRLGAGDELVVRIRRGHSRRIELSSDTTSAGGQCAGKVPASVLGRGCVIWCGAAHILFGSSCVALRIRCTAVDLLRRPAF
ncbi:hypothetical protein C8J57DRAFT_1466210 [Mycena rebaudengoi]|nr:hypothetical protein C8J57DRAFT_1466210 [Mycena rebaudengoi]